MTTRDYDYLTLRNLQCYEASDGSYVTPGYVLTAGVRGQGIWAPPAPTGPTGSTGPTGPTGTTGPTGSISLLNEGTVTISGGSSNVITTVTPPVALSTNAMVIIMPITWDPNLEGITAYLNVPNFDIQVRPYAGSPAWSITVRWWVLRN